MSARVIQRSIKRMCQECTWNLDKKKALLENCKLIGIFVCNFCRVHSNSKEISYLSWQNKCCNWKTTSRIKPNFFLVKRSPRELNSCEISHIWNSDVCPRKLKRDFRREIRIKIAGCKSQNINPICPGVFLSDHAPGRERRIVPSLPKSW